MRYRNPLTIPAAIRTPGEQIAAQDLIRGRARAARDAAALRASGKQPHAKDPDDPWSEVVWRVCEDDCPQHRPPLDSASGPR